MILRRVRTAGVSWLIPAWRRNGRTPGRLSLGGRRRSQYSRPVALDQPTAQRIHKINALPAPISRTHQPRPPSTGDPAGSVTRQPPMRKRRRHRPQDQLNSERQNQPSRKRPTLGLGGRRDHLARCYLLHINDDLEQGSNHRCHWFSEELGQHAERGMAWRSPSPAVAIAERQDELQTRARTG
jgi:hypothetical protein